MPFEIRDVAHKLISYHKELHKKAGTASLNAPGTLGNQWLPEYIGTVLASTTYDVDFITGLKVSSEASRAQLRINKGTQFLDNKIKWAYKKIIKKEAVSAIYTISDAHAKYISSLESTMSAEVSELVKRADNYSSARELVENEILLISNIDLNSRIETHKKEIVYLDSFFDSLINAAERAQQLTFNRVAKMLISQFQTIFQKDIERKTSSNSSINLSTLHADATLLNSTLKEELSIHKERFITSQLGTNYSVSEISTKLK